MNDAEWITRVWNVVLESFVILWSNWWTNFYQILFRNILLNPFSEKKYFQARTELEQVESVQFLVEKASFRTHPWKKSHFF